jgi:succinate dehydrogenase/fumarate reductase flavoprotein subunit
MPAEPPILPDIDCDVLIVGSGAAGLSAAVTAAWHGLKVIVVEKDAVFGGATAWSGGWAWVPCNPWPVAPASSKTWHCHAPI